MITDAIKDENATLKETTAAEQGAKKKEIIDLFSGEANLRSKRELIEKCILENLPNIEDADIPR